MPVEITIRNVPEEIRDALAVRAARERQSMQAFLRRELERIAAVDERLQGVSDRKATAASRISTASILNARDADRT